MPAAREGPRWNLFLVNAHSASCVGFGGNIADHAQLRAPPRPRVIELSSSPLGREFSFKHKLPGRRSNFGRGKAELATEYESSQTLYRRVVDTGHRGSTRALAYFRGFPATTSFAGRACGQCSALVENLSQVNNDRRKIERFCLDADSCGKSCSSR